MVGINPLGEGELLGMIQGWEMIGRKKSWRVGPYNWPLGNLQKSVTRSGLPQEQTAKHGKDRESKASGDRYRCGWTNCDRMLATNFLPHSSLSPLLCIKNHLFEMNGQRMGNGQSLLRTIGALAGSGAS